MSKTRILVLTAFLGSLIAVSTRFLGIYGATGYYHMGDGVLFFSALILPPMWAFFAAAVGSSLANLLGGLIQWAPWTFFIKGTAALLISWLARGRGTPRTIAGLVAGSLVIIVGYGLGTWFYYGWPAVAPETYGNLGQTGLGIVLALVLRTALKEPLKGLGVRIKAKG